MASDLYPQCIRLLVFVYSSIINLQMKSQALSQSWPTQQVICLTHEDRRFPHVAESVGAPAYRRGLRHISNPNEEETWIIQTHAPVHIAGPASESLSITRGHAATSRCVCLHRKCWTVPSLSHRSRQKLGPVWFKLIRAALTTWGVD